MPSVPTTPLPTPLPAPRRPPLPANVLRAVAVLSVIGLAYIMGRDSEISEAGAKTLAIAFDPLFPSPLIRAATPIADGFDFLADSSKAIATGLVTTANPGDGTLVLLHKFRDNSGETHYYKTHHHGGRGLLVAVGDPVVRGQKLAEAADQEILISKINAGTGKNNEISIEEFLRKNPSLASPEYAIPAFLPHGGGEPPIIFSPEITPQPPLNLESP